MAELPVQPQSQPTKQGINWKNILIGVVIGAVLVGVGVLVFYLYQGSSEEATPTTTPKTSTPSAKTSTPSAQKDETADWVLFEDKVLGFSLKHPTKWFKYPSTSEDISSQISNYDMDKAEGTGYDPEKNKGDFKIQVDKVENTSNQTLEQYIADKFSKSETELPTIISQQNKFINENKAIIVEFKTSLGTFANVYIERKSSIYIIHGLLDYESNKKTFNLIVSTFKFLD